MNSSPETVMTGQPNQFWMSASVELFALFGFAVLFALAYLTWRSAITRIAVAVLVGFTVISFLGNYGYHGANFYPDNVETHSLLGALNVSFVSGGGFAFLFGLLLLIVHGLFGRTLFRRP